MTQTTKLTPKQKADRQRLASYHSIQPSAASATLRSQCGDCNSANIAWVTTEAYLSVLSAVEDEQRVIDAPEGEGWVCLECTSTGYVSDIYEHSDDSLDQAERDIRAFNDANLLSKIPSEVLSDQEKRTLDYFLTTINMSGLQKEYDYFFELVSELSPHELELAGGSISRELKVSSSNPVVLRNMIALSLLAAPVVNAFAPDTTSTFQMPLIVKRAGQALTEVWCSDDFRLLDEQRANYARGLLMRRLVNPESVIGHGYHEDLYTQWIGYNFDVLAEYAAEVNQHGGFDFDAMTRWVGKEEATRFIVESELNEKASLTSSVDLGYVLESAETRKGKKVGALTADDRAIDESGHYAFSLSQLAFLQEYGVLQGYVGRAREMPVYKIVEALGLVGVADGGDGLAEEVALALTAVDQKELEPLVPVVAGLSDLNKVRMIETLDGMVTDIELQDAQAGQIVETLSSSLQLVSAV